MRISVLFFLQHLTQQSKLTVTRTTRLRNAPAFLLPKFFFSKTQQPCFWVSGKQWAVQRHQSNKAIGFAQAGRRRLGQAA